MSREPQDQLTAHGPLVGDAGNTATNTSLSDIWRSKVPEYAQDDMDIFQNIVDSVMPGATISVNRGVDSHNKDGLVVSSDTFIVSAQRKDADGRSQHLELSWEDSSVLTWQSSGSPTPADQRQRMTTDWRVVYSDSQFAPAHAPRSNSSSQWDAPQGALISRERPQILEWDNMFSNRGGSNYAPEGSVADRLRDAIKANNVMSPHF